MSSMPMHVMTIVAALALLTVAFVMSYKKKSKSEEDYQAKKLPRGYNPNIWGIHPITGKIYAKGTPGQTSR